MNFFLIQHFWTAVSFCFSFLKRKKERKNERRRERKNERMKERMNERKKRERKKEEKDNVGIVLRIDDVFPNSVLEATSTASCARQISSAKSQKYPFYDRTIRIGKKTSDYPMTQLSFPFSSIQTLCFIIFISLQEDNNKHDC